MGKIIAIAIAILVILGSGVGVMKFMHLGPFKEKVVTKAKIQQKKLEEHKIYLDVPVIKVPVIIDGKSTHVLQFIFAINVKNLNDQALVMPFMPRIQDLFFSELYTYLPYYFTRKKVLDLRIIKGRLQRVVNKLGLGDIIQEILVTTVVDNPG